jgi:hypothetical protein
MSTLVIACPVCLQKIRAPGSVIGRQIRCPQCKNGFTVADPSAPPPAAEAGQSEAVMGAEPPAADPLGLDGAEFSVPRRSGGSFMDYLVFRRMVTPVILTGLFYFVAVVIVLLGLIYAVVAIAGMFAVGRGSVLIGLLSLLLDFVGTIIALVWWRVVCEMIITLFRMLEQLRDINDKMNMR